MPFKPMMQWVVKEHRAIITNCRLCEDDAVGSLLGLNHRELLTHTHFDVACCVANLEEPIMVRIGVLIGVDRRMGIRALWKEVFSVQDYSPSTWP